MDSGTLTRALGLARAAFGVALVSRPERLTSAWIGRDAARPGTQVAVQGLGARDLVLGLGAAAASGSDRRRWLAAGMAGDLADLGATLAAGSKLPLKGRVLVALLAGAGIAAGGAALAGLPGSGP